MRGQGDTGTTRGSEGCTRANGIANPNLDLGPFLFPTPFLLIISGCHLLNRPQISVRVYDFSRVTSESRLSFRYRLIVSVIHIGTVCRPARWSWKLETNLLATVSLVSITMLSPSEITWRILEIYSIPQRWNSPTANLRTSIAVEVSVPLPNLHNHDIQ